jgi:hypothetical protein
MGVHSDLFSTQMFVQTSHKRLHCCMPCTWPNNGLGQALLHTPVYMLLQLPAML